MIHDRFCCNRRSAAATSLRPAGSPLGPSTYCTSTHRVLTAPRAGLATRLSDFATNRHASCGQALDMAGPTIIMSLRPVLFLSSTEARCAFSRDLRGNSGTVLSNHCGSLKAVASMSDVSFMRRMERNEFRRQAVVRSRTVELARGNERGAASRSTPHGTSCIFSRCRRGRGRCGRLCCRFAEQSEVRLVLLRD
jgi:hypothetical protein